MGSPGGGFFFSRNKEQICPRPTVLGLQGQNAFGDRMRALAPGMPHSAPSTAQLLGGCLSVAQEMSRGHLHRSGIFTCKQAWDFFQGLFSYSLCQGDAYLCPALGFEGSKIDERWAFLFSGVPGSGGADVDTQLYTKTRSDKHPERSAQRRLHEHKARIEGSGPSSKVRQGVSCRGQQLHLLCPRLRLGLVPCLTHTGYLTFVKLA